MQDDSQTGNSIWMATADTPLPPRLQDNVRTDVCIIGAGIAGLTTAYLLSLEGRSVVVLDDGPIGGGMTGRTTAHLTNAFDDRYSDGLSKIAVFRDKNGAIHKRSAVCPHLAASLPGTRVKKRGIVRVMVRGTAPKGVFTKVRQTRIYLKLPDTFGSILRNVVARPRA
jgi:monoamine oxidase